MLTLGVQVQDPDWELPVWVKPVLNPGYSVVYIAFFYAFKSSGTKESNEFESQNHFPPGSFWVRLMQLLWFKENSQPFNGLNFSTRS